MLSQRAVETSMPEQGKGSGVPSEAEFEALFRRHQRAVYGLCYRYTGGAADAEDLTQEAFLRAYRGLRGFRGEAKFSTWLYRIAVNVCLNWISVRRLEEGALPAHLADPAPTPLERLGRKELAERMRRAVGALPNRQRMTLVLRIYQELSHKEIAEIMECSIGTAKANLFFALQNLRKTLGSESTERGSFETGRGDS